MGGFRLLKLRFPYQGCTLQILIMYFYTNGLTMYHLQEIRDALKEVKREHSLSFKGLADCINHELYQWNADEEREVTERIVWSFLVGDKDKYGIRNPTKPSSEMLAIFVDFLSENKSTFQITSRDILVESSNQEHSSAAHLKHYLSSSLNNCISPEKLCGQYNACLENLSYILKFSGHSHANVLNTSLIISSCKSDAYTVEDKFSGWGLLTPEDNLMVFLKNDRTLHNFYLYIYDFSDEAFEGESPKSFFAIEQDIPPELLSQGVCEVKGYIDSKSYVFKKYFLD